MVIDFRAVGWLLKEPFFLIGFTRQDEIYDFSRGLFLGGIEPPREKVFPQHLTSPGHFVSSTTYFLQPSSFFFSPPMTCLFLAEGFSNLSTVLKNWSFRSSAPTSSPIVATSSPLPSAWHGMVHLARFAELSLSIWSNAKL